ncbi:metal-dependent hydrolase [Massilia sp. ZL223]|uniref:metal-dependent hydrolase n=1 Tax=Massilia sp. ZL223 TaxID=2824904 RepID=UPI001B815D81|nr:metal-dependent hydrolase [Massilia sp. ZL223]MBQ5962084.1 metal-dependent hydrolase [Massilia sp. ZL223]
MDNLTHSLVGLALGELVERALPAEPDPMRGRTRRRALLTTGLLASNFPDLDLILTPLLAPPLGYLMHHRGHTHTLLWGLPQVALLLALMWLLWPRVRRLLLESRTARRGLIATGVLGIVLHMGFDGLNVYGVHPFHPFDARWLYGDLVFIVEPVFWTAFGTAMAMVATRRGRWPPLVLLAAAFAAFAWMGFLQWGSLVLLAGVAGAVMLAARRSGTAALVTAVLACIGFIGVQALGAHLARAQIRAELAQRDPGGRVLDLPLSAFPSNPLCWAFATVSDDAGAGSYAVRVGVLSLAPDLNPVSQCPARFGGQPGGRTTALAWRMEHTGSLAGLRALQRNNCHFDAWTRFARVPSLAGGNATDLRFGEPDQPNFSTLPYARLAGQPCPTPVPAWGRPRADLLGLGAG